MQMNALRNKQVVIALLRLAVIMNYVFHIVNIVTKSDRDIFL